MRDNEKILRLIGDTESFIKSRMTAVIEAGAKGDTIESFVQCLQVMEQATTNLGEYQIDNLEAVYEVAREAIAPIEKRLIQLIERVEGTQGGDRNG